MEYDLPVLPYCILWCSCSQSEASRYPLRYAPQSWVRTASSATGQIFALRTMFFFASPLTLLPTKALCSFSNLRRLSAPPSGTRTAAAWNSSHQPKTRGRSVWKKALVNAVALCICLSEPPDKSRRHGCRAQDNIAAETPGKMHKAADRKKVIW